MQAIFLQIISKIAYPIINKRALPSKVETLATHDRIHPDCSHYGIPTAPMVDDGQKSQAYKTRKLRQSLIIKLQNVNALYSVRVTDGRPVIYIVLNRE